ADASAAGASEPAEASERAAAPAQASEAQPAEAAAVEATPAQADSPASEAGAKDSQAAESQPEAAAEEDVLGALEEISDEPAPQQWPDITDEVEELRFFIASRFEDD